jgi:hypothetical protein
MVVSCYALTWLSCIVSRINRMLVLEEATIFVHDSEAELRTGFVELWNCLMCVYLPRCERYVSKTFRLRCHVSDFTTHILIVLS